MRMIGLKRGTVTLVPHHKEWTQNAERTIQILKRLLAPAAVDIQHIGSTAIPSIHAKPIIDLVIKSVRFFIIETSLHPAHI